jgi:hypothetical protein
MLQVTDVDTSALGPRSGHVAVYATLDESAALHHADGRQADNYRTTYDAKYHVVQVAAIQMACLTVALHVSTMLECHLMTVLP